MQQIREMCETCSGSSPSLTVAEVTAAVLQAQNNKAPGLDGVPVEFLKALVASTRGAQLLTEFYQRVFDDVSHPTQWGTAIVTLLGKVELPSHPRDLRPIAVHSQIANTYARIMLNRVRHAIAPRQAGQCACLGRQQSDYTWSMQRVCQLALEWGEPLMIVKVDISKAYDSIKRVKLATVLQQKLVDFPQECRALLLMLLPGEMCICTPWGDALVDCNAGVKQGAVESPALFVLAMEEILTSILEQLPLQSWMDTGNP